jgi:hypothetical protein
MSKGKDALPNRKEPEPTFTPEDVDVVIPCLKCRRPFPSIDHIRNRLCPECERSNSRERGTRVISTRAFTDAMSAAYDTKVI